MNARSVFVFLNHVHFFQFSGIHPGGDLPPCEATLSGQLSLPDITSRRAKPCEWKVIAAKLWSSNMVDLPGNYHHIPYHGTLWKITFTLGGICSKRKRRFLHLKPSIFRLQPLVFGGYTPCQPPWGSVNMLPCGTPPRQGVLDEHWWGLRRTGDMIEIYYMYLYYTYYT